MKKRQVEKIKKRMKREITQIFSEISKIRTETNLKEFEDWKAAQGEK